MKVYDIFVSCLLFLSALTACYGQMNSTESFNDCNQNIWSVIQENPNETSWVCQLEFDDNVLGLRGNEAPFDIWLISPEFDFSTVSKPYLLFNYKNKIVNGELELLYTEDYTGNTSYEETVSIIWNEIPIDIYPIGDDREINNFIRHPSIDLSFLEGKQQIHFAFRFINTSDDFDFLIDELSIGSDYYTEIQQSVQSGMRCADLKTSLSQLLIRDHKQIPYTGADFDVWDSQFTTDLRVSDDGLREIIWDMYSDVPDGDDPYEFTPGVDRDFGQNINDEGLFYNREHTFPQSWWGGAQENFQFSDIHFVIPTDKEVNGIRLNFPYGETDDPSMVTANGSMRGSSSFPGFRNVVFEPIDEYKGDIARMQLYIATRYEQFVSDWEGQNGRGSSVMVAEAYPFYEEWYINLLLKWHEMDPVSQKELNRNKAVFAIQKNRNPFIDHPEYANLIWGNIAGEACDMITSVDENLEPDNAYIIPNPASTIINIRTQLNVKSIECYNLKGQLIQTVSDNFQIDISSYNNGIYFLKIYGENNTVETIRFVKI